MTLCGWETSSMFDRCNIIDEADLAVAVATRFIAANNDSAELGQDAVTPKVSTSGALAERLRRWL